MWIYFSCRGAGEGETWGEPRRWSRVPAPPPPPASPADRLFRVFCCTKPGRSRFESYYQLGQPAQVRILSLSASNDNVSEWLRRYMLSRKNCDSKRCNSHVAPLPPSRLVCVAVDMHLRMLPAHSIRNTSSIRLEYLAFFLHHDRETGRPGDHPSSSASFGSAPYSSTK